MSVREAVKVVTPMRSIMPIVSVGGGFGVTFGDSRILES